MTNKQFDFIGKRKIFLLIAAAVLVAGLVANIFLGTELDINFKGGAIFTYAIDELAEQDKAGVDAIAKDHLGDDVAITYSEDISGESVQVTFTLTKIPSTVLTYQVTGTANVDALKSTGAKVFGCETRVEYNKEAGTVTVDPVEVVTNKMVAEYTAALKSDAKDAPQYTLVSSNTVTELGNAIYNELIADYGTKLVYTVTAAEVKTADVTTALENALVQNVTGGNVGLAGVTVAFDKDAKTLSVVPEIGGNEWSETYQKAITETLKGQADLGDVSLSSEVYNTITLVTSNSVKATVGKGFFIKCLFAMVLGGVFLTLYIGIRFRKIGGVSAGIFATFALIHDILIAYLVYVIFQIPLNDNFIAVVLTILGYSINGTIVVYDRIRENERKYGSNMTISEIVNTSVNQTFARNVFTSLSTLIAVGCIAVVAKINGLDSILSFAFPMAVGLVAGFYSSVLLSSPMWAWWRSRKQ